MSPRQRFWPVVATAPIALAFAVLAAVELFYFPGRDSTLHVAALRTKAVALAELTAHGLVPAFEFEDDGVLVEFLSGVARDKEVARALACSNDGAVLRGVGASRPGETCRRVTKTEVELDAEELRVLTPIVSRTHPGTLQLSFRTHAIVAARRSSERVALGIAAGILALGLGVAWWSARILRRLRDARARAEAASATKSAFLANMSHEIRTPMNGVLGVAQLLAKTNLDERQRRHVETITRSGELLVAIINDILDFSKVEAGKLEIVKAPLELSATLRDVVDAVAHAARDKGLFLEQALDPELPARVVADGLRVKQILLNLLSNAIKFTARGSVRLCAARVGSGDTARLRFEVIDSGIGIPPEQTAFLFQAFSQVDGQSTRRYGGTGLGLAICKRLAELMGGTMGFESEVGRGSTFWCELPLVSVAPLVAVEGREPQSETVSMATLQPVSANGLRILAVDDNEINRVVIEEMAAELGYPIELVDGGREAVRRVTSGEAFAVVLMDCQMPDIDGYMAAREIRAWEARASAIRTPIVAVTAHALEGELEKVRAAGMDDYLSKPVDLVALQRMLQKWLPRNAA